MSDLNETKKIIADAPDGYSAWNSYSCAYTSCDHEIQPLKLLRTIVQQAEKIADLENEIERLNTGRDECHAFIFRNQAFVVRSIEKLKGIPEFEPTADVLNRALKGTPKSALAKRDLEQQATGLEDYVSKAMENAYIAHLDPNNVYHSLLINLNASALRLRKQAEGL